MAEQLMEVEAIQETGTVVEPLEDEEVTKPEEEDRKAGIASTRLATAIANNDSGIDAYNQSVVAGTADEQNTRSKDMTSEMRATNIVRDSDVKPLEESQVEMMTLQDNITNSDPTGLSQEDVRNHPNSVKMSEEEIKTEALHTYIRETASQFNSKFMGEDALGMMGSIGGLFIPKREPILLNQVWQEAGWTKGAGDTIDVVVNDTDDVRQFRNMFAGLPLESKAIMIKEYAGLIEKYGDNPIVNANAFNALFSDIFEGETTRTFFNHLDSTVVLDIAFLGKVAVQGAVKTAKIINQAKRMKDVKGAVNIIEEAAGDTETYAKVGHSIADSVDAQDVTTPASARGLLTGADETMTGEIVAMMSRQNARLARTLETRQREGILSAEEQLAEIARVDTLMDKQENVKSGSVVIEQVDNTSYNIKYKEIQYDKNGEAIPRKFKKVEKNVAFTSKGVKPLNSAEEEYIDGWARLDPNARMTGKLRNMFTSLVEKLSPEQARLTNTLDLMVRDAFKGLNKKDAALVDTVLKRGAKDGRTYNFEELTNPDIGIGVENITLTDKQAKAYIGYRNVMDNLWTMENARFTENLSIRGRKIADLPDQAVPAKAFETPEGAYDSFTGFKGDNNDSPHILVMGNHFQNQTGAGSTYRLQSFDELAGDDGWDIIRNWYDKGYQLMKVDNPQQLFKRGDTRTQWALVKNTDIADPRGAVVLNRVEGYVPKARKNGFFYIKSKKKGMLSGAKNSSTRNTVAWSDNLADAQKYVDDLRAQGDNSEYQVLSDREIPTDELLYDTNHSRGGMHSGARATEEIPFVGQDEGGEFVSSMEALQGYVNHIGKQFPINMVRMGMEKRALETAREITGLNSFRRLDDLLRVGAERNLSPKTQALLKDMHDQIAFISNIPTADEIATSKRVLELGKAIEGSWVGKMAVMNKVPKFLYNQAGRGAQPVDVVRSLTFMHMLGLYNPAQLLIQASGAFVSFAVNPVHFIKSSHRAIGYGTLDLAADNPEMLANTLKWFRQNGMDDYADGYELWHRTGLRENVTNSNADYTSVFMKNLPYDANILQKAMSNHTMFYEMGELVNTRFAFSTALSWYKKKNGIKASADLLGDDVALTEIMKRTEIYRLNMSRANQSDLNKGLKSVPLQFKQVISKYFEKVLPKGFGGTDELTGLEKVQLGAIPTALAGVTGIPLLEPVSVEILKMMDVNPQDLSPADASLIKFGALGWMLNEKLDINVDMTSRMSLGDDVLENAWKTFNEGQAVWKVLGGPSANVAKRYASNIQYLFQAFDMYTDIDDSATFEQDVEVGAHMLWDVLTDIALDIPTVSRNARDYFAHNYIDNPAFRKNGKYLIDFETMNAQTQFFAVAGFQPVELQEAYEASAKLRTEKGSSKGASPFFEAEANLVARILDKYVLRSRTDTEKRVGALLVRSIYNNRTVNQAHKLKTKVNDIMMNPKLNVGKTYRDSIIEMTNQQETGLDYINSTMSNANKLR